MYLNIKQSLFILMLLLGYSGFGQTYKYDFDTIVMFDMLRNRQIPIARYQPQKKNAEIVIISHGYNQNMGTTYLGYSFIAHFLASKGYFVVSVQHELVTDSLIPLNGIPQVVRKPFWERGVENLYFVINELKKTNPRLNFKKISLIGHSNGGDISALFPQKYPNLVHKIITLDNRRVILPRTKMPQIYSLRSSDQVTDQGVLPTIDEQKKYHISIVNLTNTLHHEMCDQASDKQKEEIIQYLSKFFN